MLGEVAIGMHRPRTATQQAAAGTGTADQPLPQSVTRLRLAEQVEQAVPGSLARCRPGRRRGSRAVLLAYALVAQAAVESPGHRLKKASRGDSDSSESSADARGAGAAPPSTDRRRSAKAIRALGIAVIGIEQFVVGEAEAEVDMRLRGVETAAQVDAAGIVPLLGRDTGR